MVTKPHRRSGKSGTLKRGDVFSRWTVIGDPVLVGNERGKRLTCYLCKCNCGTERLMAGIALTRTSGPSLSCGCLTKESAAKRLTKHGNCGKRLYEIWRKMVSRCHNRKCWDYPAYGAKGVSVSREWHDYATFEAWANASGYSDTLTIDRIDGKGNYCPDNCRWTTHAIQNRNTTQNVLITAFGETKCVMDWFLDPRCQMGSWEGLKARIDKGMDPELAITTPSLRAVAR